LQQGHKKLLQNCKRVQFGLARKVPEVSHAIVGGNYFFMEGFDENLEKSDDSDLNATFRVVFCGL
jgi:hypothetical protein